MKSTPFIASAARRLALVAGLLALAATACKSSTTSSTASAKEPACSAEKPCAGGLVCDAGACVACKRDRECAKNELCHPIRRRCELKPCFGNDCKVHDDCGLGQFCVQGLCLNPGVKTEAGCTVVSCAEGEACNEGDRCQPVNLVCEEDQGCTGDTDCASSERCNTATGRCELGCSAENASQLCGLKKVCADGRCAECTQDTDCGAGRRCDTERKTCESPTSCLSTRDCEIPLVCNPVTHSCTVDPGPCLSAEDCGQDQTCQLATGKCVPAACVADRFEANDRLEEAKALPQGITSNLTLCKGDADWFQVALAAGDRIQVVVDVDPLLNFDVALLDAAGGPVAEGQLAVDATVYVGGTYYVRSRSLDAYVRYDLRATVSRGIPCALDPEEPNEQFQAAKALAEGDTRGRTICPGDVDFYAVAAAPGDKVSVMLTTSAVDGPLTLALLDGSGTKTLATSEQAADTQTVTATPTSGTRLYVRVQGAASDVQNGYDLLVVRRTP